MISVHGKTERIRKLNDAFRKTGAGGLVVLTRSISSLPLEQQRELMSKIKNLDEFTPENDPYGEHDFGTIQIDDQKAFFKIDYYNEDMTRGSEDPTNPMTTTRVMTVMFSHEY